MTLTERYRQNYLPGFDCRMTTFRNNLAFYGYVLSNGMTLGLSGCLSFIYAAPAANRIPFYTIVGITDQTLEGLSVVFDTYLTRGECVLEPEGITDFLENNLRNNILINAAINRPLLNHIRQGGTYSDFVVQPTNVGFHFITITGFEADIVTFFETDDARPLEVDLETFLHLWFFDSIHGRSVFDANQSCNGKYYTIMHPGIAAQTNKHALIFSMDKVAGSYFAVTKNYSHGINGLKEFFCSMQSWDAGMTDKGCLINSLFFMKILELNLSGGGFGRRLYSSFLAESAALLHDNSLKSVAMEFRKTAKLWSYFINEICADAIISGIMENDFSGLKSLVSRYAGDIVNAENSQFENLKEWIALK